MSDQDAMRVGFILTPSYALMSLASAVEPLRAANLLAGRELYRVSFLSVSGGFMASTAGGGFVTAPLVAAMGNGQAPVNVFWALGSLLGLNLVLLIGVLGFMLDAAARGLHRRWAH